MDSGQRQPRGLELDLNCVAAAGSVVVGASGGGVVVVESKVESQRHISGALYLMR
jgi:hypothetical protein